MLNREVSKKAIQFRVKRPKKRFDGKTTNVQVWAPLYSLTWIYQPIP